jgi:hypothetical protein
MTEPAKKLSRTERLLNTRQAGTPAAKQAQSPGKPGQRASKNSAAPEQSVTHNQVVEKKTGRPSSYTEEMGLRICEHIMQGKAFTWEKLREEGLPSPSTIFRWLEDNESFRLKYARARELQATIYADEILTIADSCEDPNKARLQVDARKWHASKTAPKVWGDLQRVEVNTTINVATAHAEALMRLAGQAKQIEQQAIETTYKDVTPT